MKPQFGDGSDGIGDDALVRTARELRQRVAAIRRRSDEPLLCEEFIPGRDLFVALLGNEPKVMPPIELVIGRRGAGAPQFATYRRSRTTPRYQRKWRVGYRQAELPTTSLAKIERLRAGASSMRSSCAITRASTTGSRPTTGSCSSKPIPTPTSRAHFVRARDRCFAGVPYPELDRGRS